MSPAKLQPRTADGPGTGVNPELVQVLQSNNYDFFDFGCSEGGSYEFAQKRLGAKTGIGLDINPKKVRKARERGFEAYEQDVTQINPLKDSVRFVLMSHFLEHLPDGHLARRCVAAGVMAASEYVLIRHPFFDENGALARLGFKLHSADWRGHQNLMTSYDVWRAVRPFLDAGQVSLSVYGRLRIKDSSDPAIVPLSAPMDIRKADLPAYSEKPRVKFAFPMFKELVAIVVKHGPDGSPRADLGTLIGSLSHTEALMEFRPSAKSSEQRSEAKL
jgi:SAM-dependent methyltransferase